MQILADFVAAKRRARLIEGAQRYAAANASDPFSFRRSMAHINNGVAGLRPDGEVACYDATPSQEMRKLPAGFVLSNGDTDFLVTVYRNVQRP